MSTTLRLYIINKLLSKIVVVESVERFFVMDKVLLFSQKNRFVFYRKNLMPCCMKEIKFFEGPHGGMSINIKCAHCGHKWNICPEAHFIEDIGT